MCLLVFLQSILARECLVFGWKKTLKIAQDALQYPKTDLRRTKNNQKHPTKTTKSIENNRKHPQQPKKKNILESDQTSHKTTQKRGLNTKKHEINTHTVYKKTNSPPKNKNIKKKKNDFSGRFRSPLPNRSREAKRTEDRRRGRPRDLG